MTKSRLVKKIAQHFSLLYVEDNKGVRESTVKVFEKFFKRVEVAEDGEVGIRLYDEYFQSNGKYFDMVITDIQMPNINGIDLSRKILRKNKEQKILVTSAYDDKEYLVDLISTGVSGFIQKPLGLEQITSILYELCGELAEERELFRFLDLGNEFIWDYKDKVLAYAGFEVTLSDDETKSLDFFISDINKESANLKIFEDIYHDDEIEFSGKITDMIESIKKRMP